MGKISNSESIKGKDFEIGGISLTIYPANIDDLEYLMELGEGDKMACPYCNEEIIIPSKDLTFEEKEQSRKNRANAMKNLMYNAIKGADPESSDEEIKRFCFTNAEKIMLAIKEVNNLDAAK